jgi:hypothetical protein
MQGRGVVALVLPSSLYSPKYLEMGLSETHPFTPRWLIGRE